MTYEDFLEGAYAQLRAEAPLQADAVRFPTWVRRIGEVLHGMPFQEAHYWTEQYATLLLVKYPHMTQSLAYQSLSYGVRAAMVEWPQPLPGVVR